MSCRCVSSRRIEIGQNLHPQTRQLRNWWRHEVINTSAAPVSAQLYNQLVRDSSEGPDSHQFYSSYTGPAFYSNEGKYQKTKFSNIDKNSATFQKETQSGYVAMVQRYFAIAAAA